MNILVLGFLGIVGATLAAAADPAPQPDRAVAPAAATATALPAAASPSSSQPAAPKAPAAALSAEEQRLLNQGYKPQMRNGEKVYCRREAELGSRINAVQHCGTVAQLTTATQNGKDDTQKIQRSQVNPMGN